MLPAVRDQGRAERLPPTGANGGAQALGRGGGLGPPLPGGRGGEPALQGGDEEGRTYSKIILNRA